MSYRDFFSRQARKPTGLFGRFFMSRVFDKGNRILNKGMLDLMAVDVDDCILEIGFGTGEMTRCMADVITTGQVNGVDFSSAMVNMALKRNRHHVQAGKVSLIKGNFDNTPYHSESYTKICSANTVYFWPDPTATATKILRLLKPGGILVLAFVGKEKMETKPLNMDIFQAYSPEDVITLLGETGFVGMEIQSLASGMYCVKASKRNSAATDYTS